MWIIFHESCFFKAFLNCEGAVSSYNFSRKSSCETLTAEEIGVLENLNFGGEDLFCI